MSNRSLLSSSPEQRIDAPIARSMGSQEQTYEAEQHGRLAVILDRPESLRLMELEVSNGHLAGKDEGNRPRPQPQQDRRAAVELECAPDPYLRQDLRVAADLSRDAAEPVKHLHAAGREEQKACDDAQQKERDLPCAIHVHGRGLSVVRWQRRTR